MSDNVKTETTSTTSTIVNSTDKNVVSATPELFGREVIYTDYTEVTRDNLVEVLQKTFPKHMRNRTQIEYLYNYYRGKQGILNRVKVYNKEINNKIVENHANEIVTFKSGYFAGEPINYISREENDSKRKQVDTLNKFMVGEEKQTVDKEVSDWFHICGVGYKMAYIDSDEDELDEVPFEIASLDPRNTYVVYHSGLGHKPIMAVMYVKNDDGDTLFDIYTKNVHYFLKSKGSADIGVIAVADGQIQEEINLIGIPIVEYTLNSARIGSFEQVHSLLESINLVSSNRLDAVEQFIQALLLFHNVDISDEDFQKLKEDGGISYSDRDPQLKAEIKYLTNTLSQGDTQTLKDDLWDRVKEIVHMPSMSDGSSSDSSNNGAVILRQGWQSAEADAKNTELMFKKSEKQFLNVILRICSTVKSGNNEAPSITDLRVSDIEIKFTRRNYENIVQKAQVFTQLGAMAEKGLIALKDVFQVSNLFTDSDAAYANALKYGEELEAKKKEQAELYMQQQNNSNNNVDIGTDKNEDQRYTNRSNTSDS